MLLFYQKKYEYGLAGAYYFHKGESTNAYELLGSHRISEKNGVYCYSFVFLEKDAFCVKLVGDFNDRKELPMKRLGKDGLWYALYESKFCIEGAPYQYRVYRKNGTFEMREDPFAYVSRTEKLISSVPDELAFDWNDKKYMSKLKNRSKKLRLPISIYRACPEFKENYREFGERQASYAKEHGVTHVKLSCVLETCESEDFFGCFSPSSCHGSASDFACFVNTLHASNIGLILDFNLNKISDTPENRSLLFSCFSFWVRKYHVDGFFVSADAFSECPQLVSRLKAILRTQLPGALIIVDRELWNGL